MSRLDKVDRLGFTPPAPRSYRPGWMDVVGCCLLMLLFSGPVLSGKYRQAAYITNLYFTNQVVPEGEAVQPESVFNRLKAGDPGVSAFVVLNLLLDKGEHRVEVDILDKEGTLFDKLSFDSVLASQDDWRYIATGQFGGVLPEGGIFFRIYDSHDAGAKEVIGTARLMTEEW